MKKVIIIFVFSLLLSWCLFSTKDSSKPSSKNNIPNNQNSSITFTWNIIDVSKGIIDEEFLSNIFLPSTFSQQELDDFNLKIVNYESAQDLKEDEIIKLWKLYDNIWYTWKSLMLFFQYMQNSTSQSYEFHKDLSSYLSRICNMDISVNKNYCKKWVQSYYNLIEWFWDTTSYPALIQLLVNMWEKSTATKVYNLYVKNTWLEDEHLSNQLK